MSFVTGLRTSIDIRRVYVRVAGRRHVTNVKKGTGGRGKDGTAVIRSFLAKGIGIGRELFGWKEHLLSDLLCTLRQTAPRRYDIFVQRRLHDPPS